MCAKETAARPPVLAGVSSGLKSDMRQVAILLLKCQTDSAPSHYKSRAPD